MARHLQVVKLIVVGNALEIYEELQLHTGISEGKLNILIFTEGLNVLRELLVEEEEGMADN